MSRNWISWSDENEKYAPVIGLHQCELFYPTSVGAFLEEECELWVLVETGDHGPIFGKVTEFDAADFGRRCQLMKKHNDKLSYLALHANKKDMKASQKLQNNHPIQVYVRGFRNKKTQEGYITYWFFYVENFQPDRFDISYICEELKNDPDVWWTHQGDWEAISLHFYNYKDICPMEVIFSQHKHAEKITWQKTKMCDGRLLAIPALGSHATYNIKVKKHQIGVWTELASPDRIIHPECDPKGGETYKLVELDPKKDKWLFFRGKWGKGGGEATPAPTGPCIKTKKHFKLHADRQKYGIK